MTRKQIDSMRETRLWIGQIIVPAVILFSAMSPESKENVKNTIKSIRSKVTSKFNF